MHLESHKSYYIKNMQSEMLVNGPIDITLDAFHCSVAPTVYEF